MEQQQTITRCVLRYVVGVSIAVVLRDDKTSHASIVAVVTEYITVPYYRIMFAPTPFLIYLFLSSIRFDVIITRTTKT